MPKTVGTFEYRCDLPGHQMTGTIVVEERRTVKQTDEHKARQAQRQQYVERSMLDRQLLNTAVRHNPATSRTTFEHLGE